MRTKTAFLKKMLYAVISLQLALFSVLSIQAQTGDASITGLTSTTSCVNTPDTLKATFYTDAAATNAVITASVNGVVIFSTPTGALTANLTLPLSTVYSFTKPGRNIVKVWVSGTSYTDINHANDTAALNLNIQFSGTYTVGSLLTNTFTTLKQAIDSINVYGICGPTIINFETGHSETSVNLILNTNTTNATNTLIFNGNGAVITAGTGLSTTSDAFIKIAGTDYVTFNNFTLVENAANTTTTMQMEWGIGLIRGSATNGTQFCTIRNCNITLNKTNTATIGIYTTNRDISNVPVITTSIAGINQYNKIYGNTIQNCYSAINVSGYGALTPFTLYDQFNEIGVTSGNIISNFGGGAVSARAIYFIYQNNIKVTKNTITGGNGTTGSTVYGIFSSTNNESNIDIYENDISVTSGSASQALYGIQAGNGSTGTTNTINIRKNIVHNCTYPTATTAAFYAIQNASTGVAATLNIDSNTVHTDSLAGSGSMTGIDGGGATVTNITNNKVYNLYRTALTGTNAMNGIKTAQGSIYISGNKIYNLNSSSAAAAAVYGINPTTGTSYVYNNFISELKAPAATSTTAPINLVSGIYVSGGTAANIYYNTIVLDASSSGTNFGSSGIFVNTTPAVELKNNILVNNSTPSGTGLTVAYRRSSAILTSFSAASNKNLYYAGIPGATRLIFHDGTNAKDSINKYIAFVSPADGQAFSEIPPFTNITTPPYNLHLLTTVSTQCEGNALPVTTPAITTDIDKEARNASTPDVGADEGNFMPLDQTAPSIIYTPFADALNNTARTLTATITDPSGVRKIGTGRPVLYWRHNAGSYTAVPGTYIGSNQFTFTFGTGILPFDSVMYYIAAQDSLATPNVGVFPSGGASGFTANPPAASVPPNTPSKYYYNVVTTFPYIQDFEVSVPPQYWKEIIILPGATTPDWSIVTAGTNPTATPFANLSMAKFNSDIATAGSRARLITPALYLSGITNPQLTFNMYHDNGSTLADSLTIEVSPDRINWTRLNNYLRYAATNGWTQEAYIINLTPYTNQTVFVSFTGTSRLGNNMYIDYVVVEPGPSCPAPGNLSSFSVSTSQANIRWTAGATETQWQAEYGISGFTQGNGSLLNSTNDTLLITGLSAANNYSVYVRAICSPGDTSTWIGPADFSTPCGIMTLPVYQNFDGSVFPPNCWLNKKTGGPDNGLWDSQTTGTSPACSPHSALNMARFNSYNYDVGTKGKIVTAPIAFGSSTYWVKFWMYRDNGYSSYPEFVKVYYNTDTSLTTATLLGTVNRSMSLAPIVTAEGWYEYIFTLPLTVINQTGYISFEATSEYGNNMFIDDITIEETPSCIPPSNLTADNLSGYQATIHWTGTATNSNIRYRQAGGTSYTYLYNVTSPRTITGLTPVTTYRVWIQDSCGIGNLSAWSDSLSFTTTVSCPAPSALNAINILPTSVDLRWTAPSSQSIWQIEWGSQGFIQGSGTRYISANDTSLLTGLNASTSYGYYVRAICGAGDTSVWTGPYNFTTACVPYNTPFTEGFEGISRAGALPNCWVMTSRWNTYIAPGSYNLAARTGTNYAACSWSANDYLFTPGINLTAGTSYDVNVWYNTDGYTGWDTLAIKYGSSQTTGAMTTTLAVITSPVNMTYAKLSGRFIAPYTGVYYFGFFVKCPTSNPWYLDVDDISVLETPTCSEPSNPTAFNVTANTAALTWTPFGTYNQWSLEWGQFGFAHGSGTSVILSNDTFNLSNLNPATAYSYYVRTICSPGDTSIWAGPYNFNTSMIPLTLPVTQNFEQGRGSWLIDNGTQINQWFVGTATANNSDTSLYISYDNGTSNAYDNSASSVVYFYNDIAFTSGTPTFNLSFDWKAYGEDGWDFLRVFLVDPGVTPVTGTMLTSGQIGVDYNLQNTWQNESIDLPGTLAGTTKRLVFMWRNDGSVGDNPPAAIDNISVIDVTCPVPNSLNAFNITTTTADITWRSGGNQWQVEWGLQGFTQGTGTMLWAANDTTSLNGLTEASAYSFYIRAICGPGDTTSWAGPFSFLTSIVCPAGSYEEAEVCGTNTNGGCNSSPAVFENINLSQVVCGTSSCDGNTRDTDWYILILTQTQDVTLTVQAEFGVLFGFIASPCPATGFIANSTALAGEVGTVTTTLTAGTYYVFVAPSSFTDIIVCGASNHYNATVTATSCVTPAALSALSTTFSSDLSWSPLGSEAQWQIEWGLQGFTQGMGTMVLTTNDTTTISGLLSSTNYSFYVRAICAPGDSSAWAGPYSFTTLCLPFSIPYIEGFENISSAGQLPVCWTKTNRWNTYTAPGSYNLAPHTGNNYAACLYSANDYLFTPAFSLQAGTSYDFSFWYNTDGYTGWDSLAIKMGDGQSASNMTTILSAVTAPTNTVYQKHTVTFTPQNSGIYNFGIFVNATSNPWYLDIDDVMLRETPTCIEPAYLSAGINAQSADLSWVPGGHETQWQIEWGTQNFTQGTGIIVNVNDTVYHLTGLAPSTSYSYYVRGICAVGDSSIWTGPYSFTTSLIPVNVPFHLDFETGTGTWVISNGTQTNKWFLGTATANNSDSSLYISNSNGTTNAYSTTSSSVVHFYNDIAFPAGLNPFTLSFDWKADGESGWDYLRVYLIDPSVTPVPGTLLTSGQLGGNLGLQTTWQTANIQIPASYAGTVKRLLFTWRNDGSGGTQPPAAIDNISVTVLTCPPPTSPTAYGLLPNSAYLTWVPGASETQWQLEWGTQPLTHGQGIFLSVSNDTFNLIGLIPATIYSYYVRAVCSPGDSSTWAGPYIFTTECIPVTTLPYIENFDNMTSLPVCWSENIVVPGTGTLPAWTVVSSGTNPVCSPVSGSNMAKFNSYDADDGALRLESGILDMSGVHQAKLSFFMYHDPAYSTNIDSLAVQVFDGTNWVTLGGYMRYDTAAYWKQYEYNINAYMNANMKIGFLGVSDFGNNIFIDSVYLYCVPDSAYLTVTPGCVTGSVTVHSSYSGNQTFYLRDATGTPITDWTGNDSAHVFNGLNSAGFTGQIGSLTCISNLSAAVALNNSNPPLVYYVPPQSQDSVCLDAAPFALQGGYGDPSGGTGIYTGTGISNNLFTPATAGQGQHTITYTYTVNGCTNDTFAVITVYDCHVGINDPDKIYVRIYPNPTDGKIFIEISELPSNTELNIFDIQGQVMYNAKLVATTKEFRKELDMTAYPKGIYFIKLVNDRIMRIHKVVLN